MADLEEMERPLLERVLSIICSKPTEDLAVIINFDNLLMGLVGFKRVQKEGVTKWNLGR